MNADVSNQTNISNTPFFDSLPYWWPDGTKILHQQPDRELRRLDDGLVRRASHPIDDPPLTDATGNVSPDGSKIAFHSSRDTPPNQPQTFEVYVMNADGTNQTRLTNAPGDDFFPIWSPDGTKILFDSHRDGDREGLRHARRRDQPPADHVQSRLRRSMRLAAAVHDHRSGGHPGHPGRRRHLRRLVSTASAGAAGTTRSSGWVATTSSRATRGRPRLRRPRNDTAFGGPGVDFISGGPGNDRIGADVGERVDPGSGRNLCVIGPVVGCPPPLS